MDKCRNCGTKYSKDDAFCTKCGINLRTTSSYKQGSVANSYEDGDFEDYLQLLKTTLIHPSEEISTMPWFGFVSFLIQSLLMAYAVFTIGESVLSAISEIAKPILTEGNSDLKIPHGFELYLKLFFIYVGCYVIFLVFGYLCKKYFVSEDIDFIDYTNQLAKYSNPMILIEIIFILFLMSTIHTITQDNPIEMTISLFKKIWIFLIILSSYWNISFVASLILNKEKAELDKLFIALIGLVAAGLFVTEFLKIVGNVLK